jgi:PTS system nitrogen regulatory IIA component
MLPPDLIDATRVSVDDPAPSKKRVLERAAALLAVDGEDEPTTEQIYERLLERERLGSTGLAGGVALPHARMPGISGSRGAFVRLAEAIEFDALDGEPVDLVFALLVPEEATEAHLQLLAQLAARFNQADLRQRLREAEADDMLQLLSNDLTGDAE